MGQRIEQISGYMRGVSKRWQKQQSARKRRRQGKKVDENHPRRQTSRFEGWAD